MPNEPTPVIETAERPRPRPARARPPASTLVTIGSGGALGALLRYGIGQRWPVAAGEFPWPTFAINVSGSLVLAIVATLVIERWPPTRYVRPFVGIGLCGGYTTWSTFMTETALLVRDERARLAAGYLGLSLAAGLVATYAGIGLGRLWPTEARRRSP
jgi:CrcB protein